VTAPAAEGVRIAWEQVPGPVREAIEGVCGARVARAQTQAGGFSPGLAARARRTGILSLVRLVIV
jgi:hypothetical protein